jgi:zinc/manganese transport system substrate-binding protein
VKTLAWLLALAAPLWTAPLWTAPLWTAPLCAQNETAGVRIVATLPVLGDLARQVGGEHVSVRTLGRPNEDPHFVSGTPALMSAVNGADLFVELGLSLEVWVDNVLDGARNPRVRRGMPGHVAACAGVPRRDVPAVLTRAHGDLHPDGDPHVWSDPINARVMAAAIVAGLERVAPARRSEFRAGLQRFTDRLDEAMWGKELVAILGGDALARLALRDEVDRFLADKSYQNKTLEEYAGGWRARARPLRGMAMVGQHRSWAHFAARFGLVVAGYVEPKPGVTASAADKDALVQRAQEAEVRAVVVESFYPATAARAVAQALHVPCVVVPATVGASDDAGDYFAYLDALLHALLACAGAR